MATIGTAANHASHRLRVFRSDRQWIKINAACHAAKTPRIGSRTLGLLMNIDFLTSGFSW